LGRDGAVGEAVRVAEGMAVGRAVDPGADDEDVVAGAEVVVRPGPRPVLAGQPLPDEAGDGEAGEDGSSHRPTRPPSAAPLPRIAATRSAMASGVRTKSVPASGIPVISEASRVRARMSSGSRSWTSALPQARAR